MRQRAAAPRLPFEPLEQAARCARPRHTTYCPCSAFNGRDAIAGYCYTDQDLANELGATHRQIYRWRAHGILADRADELACRIGHHPILIWHELWETWADQQSPSTSRPSHDQARTTAGHRGGDVSRPRSWRAAAACRAYDTDAFFPREGESDRHITQVASDLCGLCPVREACLDYALRYDLDGTWAGTTRPERTALRRLHGIHLEPLYPPNTHDTHNNVEPESEAS